MKLVFMLEEPSAKEMLAKLIPKLLQPSISYQFVVFEGKQDLEKQLARKLYAWKQTDIQFVVMRDQDSGDCYQIKQKLVDICNNAGKPDALVRIVCHELESWFLGDLHAVEKGLGIANLAKQQQRKMFRSPDELPNPKQILKRISKNKYQPISGSRAIGEFMNPEVNRSTSFNVFLNGIKRVNIS